MMSHRCGRLDPHDEHDWSAPLGHVSGPRNTYHCTGAPIIEGGYVAEWDAADDAAEERALRDGREAS